MAAKRDAMAESLTLLAKAFNRKLELDVLNVYCQALSDLTPQELANAFNRAVTECEFFPTVAALRKLAGVKAGGSPVPGEIAWHAVLKAIRSVGGYSIPEFEEPRIALAIEQLGGWAYLCDQESEQLNRFVRPQFLRCYVELVAVCHVSSVKLTGITENGFNAGDAILVRLADGVVPVVENSERRPLLEDQREYGPSFAVDVAAVVSQVSDRLTAPVQESRQERLKRLADEEIARRKQQEERKQRELKRLREITERS